MQSMPTTAAVVLLAAVGLVAVSGCVHLEQHLRVNRDGSARAHFHYSVPEDHVAALHRGRAVIDQWQGLQTSTGERTINWFTNETAVRRYFTSAHTRLDDYRSYRRDGRWHVDVRVHMANLKAGLMTGKFGDLMLSRDSAGNWVLEADVPADTPETALSEDQKRRVRELCDGLRIALTVTTPTRILSSTAQQVDEHTATWIFDPGRDETFLWTTPVITLRFAGDDLDW